VRIDIGREKLKLMNHRRARSLTTQRRVAAGTHRPNGSRCFDVQSYGVIRMGLQHRAGDLNDIDPACCLDYTVASGTPTWARRTL